MRRLKSKALEPAILAVLAAALSLACDSGTPIAPPPPDSAVPTSPPAEGMTSQWDVAIEDSSGDRHLGVLHLDQIDETAEGSITWEAYSETLWVTGTFRGSEFEFSAEWGGWECSWLILGQGTATVSASGREMHGTLDLNWPCEEDESRTWDLDATKR